MRVLLLLSLVIMYESVLSELDNVIMGVIFVGFFMIFGVLLNRLFPAEVKNGQEEENILIARMILNEKKRREDEVIWAQNILKIT